MEDYFDNKTKIRLWKKILCVFLSIIIALGTFITLTFGNSKFQKWLGIHSMLSAYAAEIVDTKGAIAVNEEAMLAENHTINLENRDGSNTVYLFSEPISFTDEDGNIKAKDISVERADSELKSAGFDYTNGQNDYRINFSKDQNNGIQAAFDNCSYSIIPISTITAEGTKSTAEFLNESFEVFQYENIYGIGTNLRFYPQLNGIKDEIVLNQNINKNVFSFELKTENCTAQLNEDGTISLVNMDGAAIQTFTAPFAYDSEYIEGDINSHRVDCQYDLKDKNETSYIMTITVPNEWLISESTQYPVIIDPTTSNISASADAGVYSKYSSNNYGSEQTCCFGRASDYGYGSFYTKFTVPTAIKKGAKINSAYQWMRETTGRTTTTYVTPYMVTSSWSETGIKWSNKASYNTSVAGTRKNINSKSTDDPDNSYWYKFNIAGAVKKWVDGTSNYGVAYVSSDANSSGAYNWRAFTSRTYSSSAMRPYTVINYTNDVTAPTVTSVTGNPTSWTKNNVTLTVNGAKDNSGGAGLHSTPYSFSTTKGSYSWQSGKTKVISSNCTVYVYVRDAYSNIRLVSTQTINKIDKLKPSTPTATLSKTNWSQSNISITVKSDDAAATSSNGKSGVKYYCCTQTTTPTDWKSVSTLNSSYTFTNIGNGTYNLYAKDQAGNISEPAIIPIDKVDKDKPSKPVVSCCSDSWSKNDIELVATSTDDLSGIAEYSFSESENTYNWSDENSFIVDKTSTIYVNSKDNAGNISEVTVVNVFVDKNDPTGTITIDNDIDWTKEVSISVVANDNESGLSDNPYSFSTNEDEYIWQSSPTTKIYNNCTIYVYVRDNAGNISLIDTKIINNIDRTLPKINDIIKNQDQENNNTIITIDAEDSLSGVKEYSIDNGNSWQDSNTFTFKNDSLNYIAVKVRDNAGNTSATKYYDFYKPQIYYDNGKLGLYNPNLNCKNDIYYKFEDSGTWLKYEKPLFVAENQKYIYASYYKSSTVSAEDRIYVDSYENNSFEYTEEQVDLSLKYDGFTFNIKRQLVNHLWALSFEYLSLFTLNDDSIIYIQTSYDDCSAFVKQDKYTYINESSNCLLTVTYDENEQNIIEYKINYGKISYCFDSEGMLKKICNSYRDLFTFYYASLDEDDDYCIIKDGANRETFIHYGDYGFIDYISDPNGGVINYEYDENNNCHLAKVTDQANIILNEYEYEYEYNSNCVLSKSNNKNIERDSSKRIDTITLDNGFTTDYSYLNNTVTISSSDNKTKSATYDDFGNLLSVTDEYGDITNYIYDSSFNLISIQKNGKTINSYVYDSKGNVVSETDVDGNTKYYYYDSNNRLVTTKNSDCCVHFVYDNYDNVTIVAKVQSDYLSSYSLNEYSEEYGHYDIIKYEYDTLGHLTKQIDLANNTTIEYQYDIYGNISKITEVLFENGLAKEKSTAYDYDHLGNITSEITNDDKTTYYTYDAAGRLLLTNANGKYSRIVYDNLGRVVQEIENSDYNPSEDNLPNAYGNTNVGHRYDYSDDNNLISETNKYNQTTTYEYSSVGTLLKKSFDIYDYYYTNDGKCDKVDVNGNTIVNYEYNVTDSDIPVSDGQVLNKITYADGFVVTEKIDKYGNVLKTYADGAVNFDYYVYNSKTSWFRDSLNDKTYEVITNDNGYTVNRKSGPGIYNTINYSYSINSENDVTTVTEKHFNGSQYQTVINDDSVSYTTPNTSFDYSVDKNEDSLTETITANSADILSSTTSYNKDTKTLTKNYGDVSYYSVYNNDGNIESDQNNQYTYNSLGELISSTGLVNSSYTYDDRGNMLTKTVDGTTSNFSYTNSDWVDQLTSVNGNTITYDANGNMTSYGDLTYTWSRGKLLTGITENDNSYLYKYDYNGYRTSKTVNGITTNFNILNGKVLAQSDGTNRIYFQYNGDNPIGFELNDTQYYYVTNTNGDIVGITDANGNLIATYTYDEWGKLLSIIPTDNENEDNAEAQLSIAEINPLRYRGYYYDNETGMYYLQSRYYNPDLCRFISADSFDYINTDTPMSVNAYAYCINNPLLYSDPTGCKTEENNIVMAIFQGLIAAIELDYFNSLLETIDLSLDELAKVSFTATKEISLTFITTLNVLWSYIPEYARGEAAGTTTTFTLDKMFEYFAKDNGIKKDTSVVRVFGAIFSLISFSVDMDSAGKGKIFTKSEDTIMNVVGLCIDLFSLFLGPYWSIITPISSDIIIDIIIDVTALRIKGAIFWY